MHKLTVNERIIKEFSRSQTHAIIRSHVIMTNGLGQLTVVRDASSERLHAKVTSACNVIRAGRAVACFI